MTTFGDVRAAIQRKDIGALVAMRFDTDTRKVRHLDDVRANYIADFLARHEDLALIHDWGCEMYRSVRRLQPCMPPGILMEYVQLWCAWMAQGDVSGNFAYRIIHQPIPGHQQQGVTRTARATGVGLALGMWAFPDRDNGLSGEVHKAWASNGAATAALWSIYRWTPTDGCEAMPVSVYLYGDKIDLDALDPLDYSHNHAYYGIIIPGHPRTTATHRRKLERQQAKRAREHRQTQLFGS